jgi:hypothetical protein
LCRNNAPFLKHPRRSRPHRVSQRRNRACSRNLYLNRQYRNREHHNL